MADSAESSAKGHRKKQAGPQAERKKLKKKKEKEGAKGDDGEKRRNAKAFTFKSAVRAARQARRTLDVKSKRIQVPTVDRTPEEPPPVLVAVVGPPKVGKSTLIASLIKNFTRQNLVDAHGPITVVSGEFYETQVWDHSTSHNFTNYFLLRFSGSCCCASSLH